MHSQSGSLVQGPSLQGSSMLLISMQHQVVVGNRGEVRLRQSTWLGVGEQRSSPPVQICSVLLLCPSHEPPQVHIGYHFLRQLMLMLKPGEAFCSSVRLLLDPELSLGTKRARPLLLPCDSPLAIWRQGSCVIHSRVSSEPIFNTSWFCLFT